VRYTEKSLWVVKLTILSSCRVYSDNVFDTFFKNDLTNTEVGRRHRRAILEPGVSQDGIEFITAYLGRKPNTKAFNMSLSSQN
jgi:Zn-dependent oligopeptidase